MHLNPYGADVVNFAAELANRPPASADELADRCRAAGLVLERPVEPSDLDQTLAVIDAWTNVVDATGEREKAKLVNEMLARSAAYPRLTDHAHGWHLHYRDDLQPLGAVLFALISVGTAMHLVNRGMDRLGRCAAAGCETIFADTSRTARQRYCSQPCANRDAVRRHRARQATATGSRTRTSPLRKPLERQDPA